MNCGNCDLFRSSRPRGSALWRSTLVLIAALSLALSVATRYSVVSHYGTKAATIASACSIEATRQHLVKDAITWAVLIVVFDRLRFSPQRLAFPVRTVQFSTLYFEECLYNRPPPSC